MKTLWQCYAVQDMMNLRTNKNKPHQTDIELWQQIDNNKHKILHLLMMNRILMIQILEAVCLVVLVVLVDLVIQEILVVREITIILETVVYLKEINLVIRMPIYCQKLLNKSKIRKTKKRSLLTRQLMNNQSNRKKKCQVKMAAEYNNNHLVKILPLGRQYHQTNQILPHKAIIRAKMDLAHNNKTWSQLNKKRKDKPVQTMHISHNKNWKQLLGHKVMRN